MPKAARISVPRISIPRISIPVASKKADTQSDEKSNSNELVVVALSSGVGLLISLILILKGVQAVWH